MAHPSLPLLGLALALSAAPPAPAGAEAAARRVLPPTAATRLQRGVEGDGAPLDGRLVLQAIDVREDRAEVRFGPARDGAPALAVTLRDPADPTLAAARRAGPFAVEEAPGPVDAAALDALAARLEGLDGARIWQEVSAAAPGEAEPPAAAPAAEAPDAGRLRAEHALRDALHALAIGEPGDAVERLAAISADAALRRDAGLGLAEAWLRAGQPDRARQAARAWREEAGADAGAEAVRAAALAGEVTTSARALALLGDAGGPRCDGVPVAAALDLAGQPQEAQALLEALRDDVACPAAGEALADWHFARADFAGADRVTAGLLAARPDDDGVVAQRARVLMALGRPQEAALLLEPVAFRRADSGLVSALLGALTRVPDRAWVRERRDAYLARATEGEGDPAAAFVAGVLLHYEGDFARSDALLRPLVEVFGQQPRLYIYLGMNAFNLGRRDEALARIEEAAALDAPDPDVYYCRAEILRWKDPAAALADLHRYLAQTEASPTANPAKQQRVKRMTALLQRCVDEAAPIPCVGPWEHPRGDPANVDPEDAAPGGAAWPWLAALAALAAAAVGAVWVRRRAA